MSFQIEHVLASDPLFRARVHLAFLHAALEVTGEPAETAGHPLRASLARSLFAPDLSSIGYAPAVATCPNVSAAAVAAYDESNPSAAAAAVTDDLLIKAVRSLWNKLCGFSGPAVTDTAA
ncbi:hypothetical protein OHT59_40210 [Streptomyces sp. NBC_00243]|uniref:hypothetical protein n=1 Tax=Streptomyces sp. NBC_00243 TaxID=2975688 RepID=UPI002DD7B9C9|nr:hypothetical protein [Streptomyces sp. NBC_00243]WRZ24299.1 hypothetical protein OHT59_40210 [Streptomyces sp. NBC_00243]